MPPKKPAAAAAASSAAAKPAKAAPSSKSKAGPKASAVPKATKAKAAAAEKKEKKKPASAAAATKDSKSKSSSSSSKKLLPPPVANAWKMPARPAYESPESYVRGRMFDTLIGFSFNGGTQDQKDEVQRLINSGTHEDRVKYCELHNISIVKPSPPAARTAFLEAIKSLNAATLAPLLLARRAEHKFDDEACIELADAAVNAVECVSEEDVSEALKKFSELMRILPAVGKHCLLTYEPVVGSVIRYGGNTPAAIDWLKQAFADGADVEGTEFDNMRNHLCFATGAGADLLIKLGANIVRPLQQCQDDDMIEEKRQWLRDMLARGAEIHKVTEGWEMRPVKPMPSDPDMIADKVRMFEWNLTLKFGNRLHETQ